MAVPDEIVRLVETFEQHRESYVKGHYSETQLRREFIDPFFTERITTVGDAIWASSLREVHGEPHYLRR